MNDKLLLLLALAPLAGCATAAGSGGSAREPASINYETGPCFGACPVYTFTVHRDGRGTFEGRRFTKVEGVRAFQVTAAQYRAFVAQLEPLRPASGSVRYDAPPRCESMATDLPSASVEWREASGATQSLYFYYGCDMEKNQAIGDRLRNAPALLPIAPFIKG